MARRTSLTQLPPDILDELHKRLVEANFGDYDSHVAWLQEHGFQISRSAIHRYAVERSTSILSSNVSIEGLPLPEARLRCLEVAATLENSLTPADLIKHAEELLRWVYTR